jgi:hypothetical protein
MMTQAVPAAATLLSTLPSGREIHSPKPWTPPELSRQTLEAMRAPPDRSDDYGNEGLSSDDEGTLVDPPGSFPGYQSESTRSYY